MRIAKAHAYGNDFLFVTEADARDREASVLARALCDRHKGIGADGLILYRLTEKGAAMRLLNADGSDAEVSGNGVRCLAAIVLEARGIHRGVDVARVEPVVIETDAGRKVLTLLDIDQERFVFRSAMGQPTEIREIGLDLEGGTVQAIALRVGNPQCVVLGGPLTEERLERLGPAIERHPAFPQRTNVEFAVVESPAHVRILIWERGVGPTKASGTGACAAAVAAAAYGGASRDVAVTSPGGTQRVEWRDDGLFLTGWAATVVRGEWLG